MLPSMFAFEGMLPWYSDTRMKRSPEYPTLTVNTHSRFDVCFLNRGKVLWSSECVYLLAFFLSFEGEKIKRWTAEQKTHRMNTFSSGLQKTPQTQTFFTSLNRLVYGFFRKLTHTHVQRATGKYGLSIIIRETSAAISAPLCSCKCTLDQDRTKTYVAIRSSYQPSLNTE